MLFPPTKMLGTVPKPVIFFRMPWTWPFRDSPQASSSIIVCFTPVLLTAVFPFVAYGQYVLLNTMTLWSAIACFTNVSFSFLLIFARSGFKYVAMVTVRFNITTRCCRLIKFTTWVVVCFIRFLIIALLGYNEMDMNFLNFLTSKFISLYNTFISTTCVMIIHHQKNNTRRGDWRGRRRRKERGRRSTVVERKGRKRRNERNERIFNKYVLYRIGIVVCLYYFIYIFFFKSLKSNARRTRKRRREEEEEEEERKAVVPLDDHRSTSSCTIF